MTPEAKTKHQIKKVLQRYGCCPAGKEMEQKDSIGWYFMPSASVYGVGGIPDFIGCYCGVFFAIEAKAPGKKPTERQLARKYGILRACGVVFVIDGDTSELEQWLTRKDQNTLPTS